VGATFSDVSGYRLVRALRKAPSDETWLAERDGEQVVLRRYLSVRAPKDVVYFTQRALACRALRHPAIESLRDRGRSGDQIYVARAYLGGGSLRERAAGLSDREDKLRLVLKIGEALVHSHRHGVPHGAVHADNILFDGAGAPHLVDYSLQAGKPRGENAPPDRESDARTDQYSLAKLCLSLVGKAHRPDLVSALARATSADRDLRFTHLEQFLQAVEESVETTAATEKVEVAVSGRCITVTVSGAWSRSAVTECAARITTALRPPGRWQIAYCFASSTGYRQSRVVDELERVHRLHRPLLERIAILAPDPQARGLGVVLGCSVEGLPWKTFINEDTMRAWLAEAVR
jgi:serine/threonine protein kinase